MHNPWTDGYTGGGSGGELRKIGDKPEMVKEITIDIDVGVILGFVNDEVPHGYLTKEGFAKIIARSLSHFLPRLITRGK